MGPDAPSEASPALSEQVCGNPISKACKRNNVVDPVMGCGSVVDPVMGCGSVVDPAMGCGRVVDPVMGCGRG